MHQEVEGTQVYVQGDKHVKRWHKRSHDLKAGSHPAKIPSCEKKLKKIFNLGVVGHTFSLSTPEAGAEGFLSLKPASSTDPVSRQLSLGAKGNNGNQKAGERVIDEVTQVSAPVSNRTL